MPNANTPHDTPRCAFVGDIAHDATSCTSCIARDAFYATRQRERDARRDAYDARVNDAPITFALRERYAPPSRNANRAWVAPPPRVHRDTRMPIGPNAWEAQGPHMAAHKAADPSCHHPLVKCSHKW